MYYIEKENNLIRKYEVEVDQERLQELMVLLDKDCYVRRYGIIVHEDGAHNAYEADEMLKNATNNANEKVNEAYKIISLSEGMYWYHGLPFDLKYEALYKDSVGLVKLIDSLLSYAHKDGDEHKDVPIDVTDLMHKLEHYLDSEDFVPFNVREEQALICVHAYMAAKDSTIFEIIHQYINKHMEAILNENFNFDRLRELYFEVVKCFNKVLVEEVRTFEKVKD